MRLEQFVRWLIPAICPGCASDVMGAGPICHICIAQLKNPVQVPMVHGLTSIQAVGELKGPLRNVILSFKYRGKTYLSKPLSHFLAKQIYHRKKEFDLIVPVPTSWPKQISRGFHPVDVLGAALASLVGRPWERSALRRKWGGASQASLGRTNRLVNAGKYFVLGSKAESVKGLRILLLDDVYTTGATMAACASLLMSAGAVKIHGLALAYEKLKKSPQNGLPNQPVSILDESMAYR